MSGLPTGLATNPTRLHVPVHLATCAYCTATVEFLDQGPATGEQDDSPVHRKLECASCGRRFLIERDSTDRVHKSTPCTIELPNETLAAIFAFACRTQKPHSFQKDNPLAPSTLVSKQWNATSTSFLYRHLRIGDWVGKVETTLLATLERHPALLPDIHSLKASYPRFREWKDSFYSERWSEIYEQVVEEHLGTLDADARAREEASLRTPDLFHLPSEAEAARRSILITQQEIERNNAGGWMDVSPDGELEAPRRAGAVALVNFVSRCPQLSRLELGFFDFGYQASLNTRLAEVLPSSLPSIRSLALTRAGRPDPANELLSRMPNLEELKLDEVSQVMSGSYHWSLPRLRRLDLGCIGDANYVAAVFLLRRHELHSLRSLAYTCHRNFPVNGHLEILESVPAIEELSLAPYDAHPLPATFFIHLQSQSTLKSLDLTTIFTITLVESLPTSLTRLAVRMPDREGSDQAQADAIVEALHAIVASKRSRTPLLAKLGLWNITASVVERVGVVEALTEVFNAGVVIIQSH
ncbi:hypothetical protein RQP46_000110 [Phenoliferia psychrophenolica]